MTMSSVIHMLGDVVLESLCRKLSTASVLTGEDGAKSGNTLDRAEGPAEWQRISVHEKDSKIYAFMITHTSSGHSKLVPMASETWKLLS